MFLSPPPEKPEVRYYDGMNEMNEICLSKAQRLLEIIATVDQGLLSKPLERTNILRQKADECTEMLLHYFELEVRASAGEGWGATKTLHPEHRRLMRRSLSQWSLNLEQVRLKWQEKENLAKIKKGALAKWVKLQCGEIATAEAELDKLYNVAEKVAQLLSKHSDLPGFVLPKRLPKPQAKSKPKVKPTAKALQPAEAGVEAAQPEAAIETAAEAAAGAAAGAGVEAAVAVEPVAAQPETAQLEAAVLAAIEVPDEPAVAAQPEAAVAVEPEAAQPEAVVAVESEAAQPEAAVGGEPVAAQPEAAEVVDLEAAQPKPAEVISPEAWEAGGGSIRKFVEDRAEVEAKLAELSAGEIAYNKWRDRLSTKQKIMIIDEWYEKAENYSSLKKMVEHVKNTQTLGTCSKCHWGKKGCERCNHEQSLNYVLKWGKTAAWFNDKLWI